MIRNKQHVRIDTEFMSDGQPRVKAACSVTLKQIARHLLRPTTDIVRADLQDA
jgi:hypothetical protein